MEIDADDPIANVSKVDPCLGWGSNQSVKEYNLQEPWQYTYGVIFGIVALMGAVGNATVIWICLYYRRMRTITNFFIANLAVADFLLSVMNVPPTSYFVLTQHWIFGEICCIFTQFIGSITVVASVFTMMCISIDRYIAIVHPMRPRMGRKTAYMIIAVIWISAATFSLPAALYSTTWEDEVTKKIICALYNEAYWVPSGATEFTYQVMYMIITYFVPLVALTFAYGRVAGELWGSKSIGEATSAQMETIKSKQKLVKVLIWVMITFVICWAPYHVYFIVSAINHCYTQLANMSHVFTSSYALAMSNSIYNPIIYIILNKKFRQGFRQVFRWLPCIHFDPSESLDRSQTTAVYGYRDRLSSCTDISTTIHRKPIALSLNSYAKQNGKHSAQSTPNGDAYRHRKLRPAQENEEASFNL